MGTPPILHPAASPTSSSPASFSPPSPTEPSNTGSASPAPADFETAHSPPLRSSSVTMPPKKSAERKSGDDGEFAKGKIFSISGPVIVAEGMLGCAMYKLVKVGHEMLVGGSSGSAVTKSPSKST